MYDCDVLIIGAGPVGLSLALELALQKVSFRILDKEAVPSDKSRANAVQPRTLEFLNRHGDAQSLVDKGEPIRWGAVVVYNSLVANIELDDFGTKDTRFLTPVGVSQAETERFLVQCLSRYGFSIERPLNARGVSQNDEGVTTIVEGPEGRQETIRSKYVVGCDGAHSLVRKSSSAKFEGAAYPQDFLLCDAQLANSNIPLDRFSLCIGLGTLALFPLGNGNMRLVAAGKGIGPEGEPTLEHFETFLARYAPAGCGTPINPSWITRFRLHHRIVSNYRDGRIFLAGDAAHIHSPAGGQGMNTGMQDSFNLGWKLASVLKGRAADPEALLDSYNTERRRVGQYLLNGTDRMFNFTVSTHWLWARIRNFIIPWLLPWLAAFPARRRKFLRFTSQFGVTYRKSPLVGASTGFVGPVGAGDRLPDGALRDVVSGEERYLQDICACGSHSLLLFSGSSKVEWLSPAELQAAHETVSGIMKDYDLVVALVISGSDEYLPKDLPHQSYVDSEGSIHTLFGFNSASYVLVRPDSHVAHIGRLSQLHELLDFLDRWFAR